MSVTVVHVVLSLAFADIHCNEFIAYPNEYINSLKIIMNGSYHCSLLIKLSNNNEVLINNLGKIFDSIIHAVLPSGEKIYIHIPCQTDEDATIDIFKTNK